MSAVRFDWWDADLHATSSAPSFYFTVRKRFFCEWEWRVHEAFVAGSRPTRLVFSLRRSPHGDVFCAGRLLGIGTATSPRHARTLARRAVRVRRERLLRSFPTNPGGA